MWKWRLRTSWVILTIGEVSHIYSVVHHKDKSWLMNLVTVDESSVVPPRCRISLTLERNGGMSTQWDGFHSQHHARILVKFPLHFRGRLKVINSEEVTFLKNSTVTGLALTKNVEPQIHPGIDLSYIGIWNLYKVELHRILTCFSLYSVIFAARALP